MVSPPSNGPDPSQEQRRQQEREQIERERLQPSPDVRLPSPPASANLRLPIGESPCFVLQDITLRGDLSERFGWILEALNGPNNDDAPRQQCLGAQGIALLVQRAQQALVDRGYVTSRVLTDDFEAVKAMVMVGEGIGWLPDFLVADAHAAGVLVPVLADWKHADAGGFNFLYPGKKYASPKVQAFIATALDMVAQD